MLIYVSDSKIHYFVSDDKEPVSDLFVYMFRCSVIFSKLSYFLSFSERSHISNHVRPYLSLFKY